MSLFKKSKESRFQSDIDTLNMTCDKLIGVVAEKQMKYDALKAEMDEEIRRYKANEKRLNYKIKALELADFSRTNTVNKYISENEYLKSILRKNNISYIGE